MILFQRKGFHFLHYDSQIIFFLIWTSENQFVDICKTLPNYFMTFLYILHFFAGRRSVSAVGHDRRASSSSTTSRKSLLKQEVLDVVQRVEDDDTFLLAIKQLIKKHGSLSKLNDYEQSTVENAFSRNTPERSSYLSPRKDSKSHNNMSKIPAPVFYGKT